MVKKNFKTISEEDFWLSNTNQEHMHKVGNLNSEHLANIIHFFKNVGPGVHGHTYEECFAIVEGMRGVAHRRDLTQEFLDAAPYPYDPDATYKEYQETV